MFCNKCGNQMEDDEAFCGKCGNRIGGNPQTVTAQPPAKSKKPLIALISIPLVVLIAGVSIFALRGTEKSATAAPSTASSVAEASIADASQSAAEVNTEPEEPEIAPWKQIYYDEVQNGCTSFLKMNADRDFREFYGLGSASLYDLDEDGVPEIFIDYHDIGVTGTIGYAYAIKDGVLQSDDYPQGGETSPAAYVRELRRNPQTGAYLGINEDTDTDYFLYENRQWRFLFRIYQMKVYGADTAEGKELEERLTGEAGYYDSAALDAFTAPYSEEIEFVRVGFSKDKSWLSSSQELIDLFNAYDGDDRFDVPLEDRLEKPWGETYAEIIARIYDSYEQRQQEHWNSSVGFSGPIIISDGFQVADLNMDGVPELYVEMRGSFPGWGIGLRTYYADGSWTEGIGIGINRVYQHKTDGRLMHSRRDYDSWWHHITGMSYYFSDTYELFMSYVESSVIDEYGTPYYASDNPLEEQAACDAAATAALQDSLADYEEVNTPVYSLSIKYNYDVQPHEFLSGSSQEAQAWVKSLPGAMD